MPSAKNPTLVILCFSIALAVVEYLIVTSLIPPGSLQIIRLTQTFAFTSVLYLYFTLLASPLFSVLPNLTFKSLYKSSCRALGLSAFIFAALHGFNSFFRQLGGISGIGYLNPKFLLALVLSSIALLILLLSAISSLDILTKKLLFKPWKILHRLVYISGVLILLHALMIGTHFQNPFSLISIISITLIVILLSLEGVRLTHYFKSKLIPYIYYTGLLVLLLIYLTGNLKLNIHNYTHADNSAINNPNKMPGMEMGLPDQNRKFTFSWNTQPKKLLSGIPIKFNFSIFNAENGFPLLYLATPHEKPLHLIGFDQFFQYFVHIHPQPETDPQEYLSTLTFPSSGLYWFFADFQPLESTEQVYGFTVFVAEGDKPEISDFRKPDNQGYTIDLTIKGSPTASAINAGKSTFKATIYKSQNNPITNLQPYLRSFGHLILINESSYQYFHFHSNQALPPNATDRSGPVVEFTSMPNAPTEIIPGKYRALLQLNPDGKLITTQLQLELK